MEAALRLDDPRWAELHTRNGGAAWVPAWLRHVVAQPDDLGRFNDDWPELSSENTTWSAAYAAMPYLVKAAEQLPAAERFHYAIVMGFIVLSDGTVLAFPGQALDTPGVPADSQVYALRPDFFGSFLNGSWSPAARNGLRRGS